MTKCVESVVKVEGAIGAFKNPVKAMGYLKIHLYNSVSLGSQLTPSSRSLKNARGGKIKEEEGRKSLTLRLDGKIVKLFRLW